MRRIAIWQGRLGAVALKLPPALNLIVLDGAIMTSNDSRPEESITDPSRVQRRLALAGVVSAVSMIGVASALWMSGKGAETPSVGGPFRLVDGSGRPVSSGDFSGKYLLIYFGYTYCPDVCPTTLTEISDAMDRLGSAAERIQPIFITVDPERDTPEVMKRYIANFSPGLIGLTGTPEQIAQVARAYRVYYAVHKTGSNPGDYTMDHSSIIYLMAPGGAFVAPVRADESGAQMAADILRQIS